MKVKQEGNYWILEPENKTDYIFLHEVWELKGWSVAVPTKIIIQKENQYTDDDSTRMSVPTI